MESKVGREICKRVRNPVRIVEECPMKKATLAAIASLRPATRANRTRTRAVLESVGTPDSNCCA
jgi:hypothetical protein